MRYALFLLGVFALGAIAWAQEDNFLQNEMEEEYYQQQNKDPDKSIIYVFFDNQPCPTCPRAIDMIEEVYNQNFLNNYSLFLINYAEDSNADFIRAFDLSNSLEVVMVSVNNGKQQGYQKIEGLQNMTPDASAFNNYFITQVNGYLGQE